MKFRALVLRLSEFHALWRRVSTALSYRETRSDFPGLCYPANQWSANDRWSLLALYLPVVRTAFVPCKLLHHGLTTFPPQRNRTELCCKGNRLANKDGRRLCCQSEFKVIREFQKRWPKQQHHKFALFLDMKEFEKWRQQRQRQRHKPMIWLVQRGKIIVLHVRHAFWCKF